MDKRRGKREWSVYVVRCSDGSLYTGITNNLELRLNKHNAGTGAHYTRTRRPVELLYKENNMNRSKALSREFAIKCLDKTAKEKLIAQ